MLWNVTEVNSTFDLGKTIDSPVDTPWVLDNPVVNELVYYPLSSKPNDEKSMIEKWLWLAKIWREDACLVVKEVLRNFECWGQNGPLVENSLGNLGAFTFHNLEPETVSLNSWDCQIKVALVLPIRGRIRPIPCNASILGNLEETSVNSVHSLRNISAVDQLLGTELAKDVIFEAVLSLNSWCYSEGPAARVPIGLILNGANHIWSRAPVPVDREVLEYRVVLACSCCLTYSKRQ